MTNVCGVYEIVSPSGKRYIGSSNNVPKRWREHRRILGHGTHHSPILQAAYRKYGSDGLTFRMLMVCRAEDLRFFEQRMLDGLKPEYNISESAGGYLPGYTMSDEVREKSAAARRGKKQSPEWIASRVAGRSGYRHSPEVAAKIGAANRGKKRTPEQIEVNRNSRKVRGTDHPLYEKPVSPERKAHLSKVHKGKTVSDDVRARTSQTMKGMNAGGANPMARGISATGFVNVQFGSLSEAIRRLRSEGHKAYAERLTKACESGSTAYGLLWKRSA
jgi:group I intron endonuclease